MSSQRALSGSEIETYSRQIVLQEIGFTGQAKLREAKICIIGLGGLGAHTAQLLAGLGIGYLRIVDRDIISRSDLHRQHLYYTKALGFPKAEVAAERLEELNPDVKIEAIPDALTSSNAEELVEGMDLVIDGLDTMNPRYILNRACVKSRVPYIFGAAIESFGNISTIIPAETACLECFYSGIRDEDLETCATIGVHPSIVATVSSIQVYEATRLITTGDPALKNRLLYIDLRNFSFDTIALQRREDCPVCGYEAREAPPTIEEKPIERTCGRDGKGTIIVKTAVKADIDLDRLTNILEEKRLPIRVKSRLGVTFQYDERITLSLLKSGVAIAQLRPPSSEKDTEEVLNILHKVLVEWLHSPKDIIPKSTSM